MGLWGWVMTAPCAGCPCEISAGDGSLTLVVCHIAVAVLGLTIWRSICLFVGGFHFFHHRLDESIRLMEVGEDVWWVKLNSLVKCLNSSPLKGGLLSVITTAGMPSVENRSLKYLSVLWCVVATGKMNGNLLKQSAMIKNLFPWFILEEIHTKFYPWSGWDLVWMQYFHWHLWVVDTRYTPLDIVHYICLHSWPIHTSPC